MGANHTDKKISRGKVRVVKYIIINGYKIRKYGI